MNSDSNILLKNIEKIHTTVLGLERSNDNIGLLNVDIIEWAKTIIRNNESEITLKGKNWYIKNDKIILTINKQTYTITTGHIVS